MRLLLIVISSVATVMLASAGWIEFVRLTRPSIQAAWAEGLYQRKIDAAEKLSGRRLIIIGGSGAHYGFMGRRVSEITGVPAVNLGVHAGLGLPYLLYRAKQVLRPGDFAVLAIEPSLYDGDDTSDVLSEFVLRYDLGYLLKAPLRDVVSIIYGLNPSDIIQEQARLAIPWTHPTGRAESVDQFGDETLILSNIQAPWQLEKLRTSTPFPAWTIAAAPPALKAFFDWAQANQISFGVVWTPLLDNPAYRDPPHQAFFATVTRWYTDAGGQQLGPATDYFQPLNNMYDYIYHDNERGREAASIVLARHLCKALSSAWIRQPSCPQESANGHTNRPPSQFR